MISLLLNIVMIYGFYSLGWEPYGYVLLAVVTFIDYDVKFDMSMHKVANTDLGFNYRWISLC